MPYTLTLCLDLSDQLELDTEYSDWIKKELNGQEDYSEFEKKFGSAEEFDSWIKKWSSHRHIKTYFKAKMPSKNRMGYKIEELPYEKIFVAFPIAQIIKMVNEGQYEYFVLLQSLGNEHVESFREFMSKLTANDNIPSDLRLFYKLSELENLLNGVRKIVLTILGEARNKMEELFL